MKKRTLLILSFLFPMICGNVAAFERLPINIVYVNHVEVESVIDFSCSQTDRRICESVEANYIDTSSEIAKEVNLVEDMGAYISFHISGAFAERALAAGDNYVWYQYLLQGHTVGVHTHAYLRGNNIFEWMFVESPRTEEIEKHWQDNYDLVGNLVGFDSLWVGESHLNCTYCWEALGYTLGATEEIAFLPAGQHIVWLVRRAPFHDFIVYPHFPQIGTAEEHGEPDNTFFFDLRVPQLKKEFLMLYLEWLERERLGLDPQVWGWGWSNHGGFSTQFYVDDIEEMLIWLRENFIERVSLRGNTIARFVNDHQLAEIYKDYEQLGGRPLPSPVDNINDQFPFMAFALEKAGVISDLSKDLGQNGVRLFEMQRDGASPGIRVYLLFREVDGEGIVNIQSILATQGVRHTNLTRLDVIDGSKGKADITRLFLGSTPLVLDMAE